MRWALLALVACPFLASASPGTLRDSLGKMMVEPVAEGTATPALQVAPASGDGLPSMGGLCAQLTAGEKGSGWWCLNGDGTMASGSEVTLSAVGSPTTQTRTTCPNGPNCATTTAQQQTVAGQYYGSATISISLADWTQCALIRSDATTTTDYVMGASNGASTSFVALAIPSTTFGVRMTNGCGGAATDVPGPTTATVGAIHLVCGTAAGTTVTAYQDGVAGTPATKTTCASPGGGSATWNAGSINALSAGTIIGAIYGAFYVPSAMSGDRIAAIARAVLADVPTGSAGEALTFARTSSRACPNNDDTLISMLPAGRPCVRGGGFDLEGRTVTNTVIRSGAFDNASWVDYASGAAAPTLNGADAANGVSGAKIADDYTFPATTTGQYSMRSQAAGCTANTTVSASVYVQGVSGSGTLDLCVATDNTPTLSCTACSFVSTGYTRCRLPAVAVATRTTNAGNFYVGNATAHNGDVARSSNRVYLASAQCEASPNVTSYIPTDGTAVARNADSLSVARPAGVAATGQSSWCLGATLNPNNNTWARNLNGQSAYVLFAGTGTGATPRNRGLIDSSGDVQCGAYDTGAGSTTAVTDGVDPLTGTSAKRVTCRNKSSNMSLRVDGTPPAQSTANTLTAAEFATPIYLGSAPSYAYNWYSVVVSDVKVGASARACE